jgi:hypothetical protein
MGTVWRAFDTVLHREVAVKELRIPEGLSPEDRDKLRARALREARAAAGLDHPAIVTIHDVVDEGGRPWIVMRLLPGQSLDQTVRAHGPLSPRRAAELGVRLVEALRAAHANGVLHRDVKPQNVMLSADDRWMLTDFGIASVAGATRTLTGTGIVTGTLGYVAPERLSGAEPGTAADLWALGATLYYAVEGRHAYDHDDLPAMIAAVLTRDPEPPRHAGPLAPVIAGLLERDPAKRLDAAAVREQLLVIAGGYPTFESPTVQVSEADRPTERFGSGTKVLQPGERPGEQVGPDGLGGGDTPAGRSVWDNRVLRALAGLVAVLNGAIGALLALIGYSLADGMPPWIAGALAGAIAVGAGVGAWVAPRLARWTGLPLALAGGSLLAGESIVAAGLLAEPQRPMAAVVLCGIALVSFAIWYRLSRALRQRLVPAELLGRVTTTYRWIGFGGGLLGAAIAGIYLWYVGETKSDASNYLVTLLVGAGVVVVAAAVLAIPAVRSAPTAKVKRWAPLATTSAALVIPVLVGVQTGLHYLDDRDNFTSIPDICTSSVLSQEQIAQFIEDPPAADPYSSTSYSTCTWQRIGDDRAKLEIYLDKYDNSRAANRLMQGRRSSAEDDSETVTELQVGDDAFWHPFDSYLNSEDTLGVGVEIRLGNLVLEVELERADTKGAPDAASLQALATELAQELASQRPHR